MPPKKGLLAGRAATRTAGASGQMCSALEVKEAGFCSQVRWRGAAGLSREKYPMKQTG